MKVGILSLPLHHNYGGVLQTYALQKVLKQNGHEAWFIKRLDKKAPFWRLLLSICKNVLLKFVLRKKNIIVFRGVQKRKNHANFTSFIETHIQPQTKPYYNTRQLNEILKNNFDAFVVGSDQVWRKSYYPEWKMNFFFDFLENSSVKKISYAASFGEDEWLYNEQETETIKKLIRKFHSVSVREESAKNLCKSVLNINAEHLVDPTMLLDVTEYQKLIATKNNLQAKSEQLFTFLLDTEDWKQSIVASISEKLNYKPYTIYDDNTNKSTLHINYILPEIEQFLACFNNAKYIITDSFHGCVFAIIFNKPFTVIGNEIRGLTRFNSLLKKFELQNRLLHKNQTWNETSIDSNINWELVNKKLSEQRKKALDFLNKSLT